MYLLSSNYLIHAYKYVSYNFPICSYVKAHHVVFDKLRNSSLTSLHETMKDLKFHPFNRLYFVAYYFPPVSLSSLMAQRFNLYDTVCRRLKSNIALRLGLSKVKGEL